MSNHIERLQGQIEPLRNQIINHKVYGVIENISDLKIFMQYHVYAVWDFMSLLKSLQNNLTCTSIPWFPVGDAETRYLINEIVLGEESDVDQFGKRTSHFELYLEAMDKFGSNVSIINQFISSLKNGKTLSEAFQASSTPLEASEFVNFTFEVINSNKAYLQSAVFTFGREDLIPSMFHSLINDMYQENSESISYFKYYLERHIEVDGDHHSHLALQMTANLCGDDDQKWIEAENVVLNSLRHRLQLWDGAYNEIVKTKDLVC